MFSEVLCATAEELLEEMSHGASLRRRSARRAVPALRSLSCPQTRVRKISRAEVGEDQLDGLEGFGSYQGVFFEGGEQGPSGVTAPVNLQRPKNGIEEPTMTDLLARIDRQLAGAIAGSGFRRENLAHPVGR
jgi:hypothetical protein